MHRLAQLDHAYVWHPFTQMQDWLQKEPIIIVAGKGAVVRDVRGKEYLDANSSIWTNLHGHNHPKINAAIRRQLKRIAHSSALGLANEPATLLAEALVGLANRQVAQTFQSALPHVSRPAGRVNYQRSPRTAPSLPAGKSAIHQVGKATLQGGTRLSKVFFSDDGSTAMEVALKLAYEYARRSGLSQRPRFLSLHNAYHGDTVGAVSLGHIDLFHKSYAGLLFQADEVMAPYCYRCPFNRAKPERADAREYRKCNWECIAKVEQKFAGQKQPGRRYAAMVVEPLIQGAAGMVPQPRGWFSRAAEIARAYGAQLIADEVMTGFGRTGVGTAGATFACQQEGVNPDFLVLAKGLTGGYLPMAATLTTGAVFEAFLGKHEEFKTFFHGHSYTGNQLGGAAALANLEILQSDTALRARQELEAVLRAELRTLWELPNVGDIRQAGLVVGVELVKDWRTRQPFDLRERAGVRVCEAMTRLGVLTRPVGNVIVIMPPYCTTPAQAKRIVAVLNESISECWPGS